MGCDPGSVGGTSGTMDAADRFDAGSPDASPDTQLPDTQPPPPDGPPPEVGPPPDMGPPPVGDDAQVVFAHYPYSLFIAEAGRITVWMRNTGSNTWTRDRTKLSSIDGDAGTDVQLWDMVAGIDNITTGQVARFDVFIYGPGGSYGSDWRMHNGSTLFGAVTTGTVQIVPPTALCPSPTPGPLDRMNAVIHAMPMPDRMVLDSTPQQCEGSICGFYWDPPRRCCPPRPEGFDRAGDGPDESDEAEVRSCNGQVAGFAQDTGREGPTWTFNEQPCTEEATARRCRNHANNQFLVFIYGGGGTARACGRNGVCGEVYVPPF